MQFGIFDELGETLGKWGLQNPFHFEEVDWMVESECAKPEYAEIDFLAEAKRGRPKSGETKESRLKEQMAPAKRACDACKVFDDCAAYAEETKSLGIWAGSWYTLAAGVRKKIARLMSHFTP